VHRIHWSHGADIRVGYAGFRASVLQPSRSYISSFLVEDDGFGKSTCSCYWGWRHLVRSGSAHGQMVPVRFLARVRWEQPFRFGGTGLYSNPDASSRINAPPFQPVIVLCRQNTQIYRQSSRGIRPITQSNRHFQRLITCGPWTSLSPWNNHGGERAVRGSLLLILKIQANSFRLRRGFGHLKNI